MTGDGGAGDIGLLKGVRSDDASCHLAGDADNRGGIEHCRCHAGNHIGGAGSRRRHGDADLSAGAGVAIGHMGGALFMTNQHVMDLVPVFVQGVVGGEDGTAGIAEDYVYIFANEAFPDDFSAGESL